MVTNRSISNRMHPSPQTFNLKNLTSSNLIAPGIYILVQGVIGVCFSMVTMHYSFLNEDAGQNEKTKIIKTIKLFRIIYPIVTLITISLYFLAAFTNPGYIIGNTRLPKPK